MTLGTVATLLILVVFVWPAVGLAVFACVDRDNAMFCWMRNAPSANARAVAMYVWPVLAVYFVLSHHFMRRPFGMRR